jgi:hypothetical protein
VRWLQPLVDRYRGRGAALRRMRADGVSFRSAVVVARELMGPDTHSLADACGALLATPAWSSLADTEARNPGWFLGQFRVLEE